MALVYHAETGRPAVDWGNPLTRGLAMVLVPGSQPMPIFLKRGVVVPTMSANARRKWVGPHLGLGVSTGTGYLGSNGSGNTFSLNEGGGTVIAYVVSGFAPTDSGTRGLIIFSSGTPKFEMIKWSDNNWYCGWQTASDTRLITAASGTFSAGQPFTAALVWDKTSGMTGSKFYTKGILRASSGTTPSTGAVNGGSFNVGATGDGSFPWLSDLNSAVYAIAVWDRPLTPVEVNAFEFDPWAILAPEPLYRVGSLSAFPVSLLHRRINPTIRR